MKTSQLGSGIQQLAASKAQLQLGELVYQLQINGQVTSLKSQESLQLRIHKIIVATVATRLQSVMALASSKG